MLITNIVIILKYVDERFLFEMLDVREKMNLSELGRVRSCCVTNLFWPGHGVQQAGDRLDRDDSEGSKARHIAGSSHWT